MPPERAVTPLHVNTVVVDRAPAPLRFLALLPHQTGDLSAPEALEQRLDPGFDPTKPDPALQTALDEALHAKFGKQLPNVPLALVDLSRGVDAPRFAGRMALAPRYPASIGKLAALLGAFQLRHDLQVLATTLVGKTQAELFDAARRAWGATQAGEGEAEPLVKGSKLARKGDLVLVGGAPVRGTGVYLAPQLSKIFEDKGAEVITAATADEFARFTSSGIDDDTLYKLDDDLHDDPSLLPAGFEDRLALMIGYSNNVASGECIRSVGFVYPNSALLQSGIYDPLAGGLWLGSSYAHDRFRTDPVAGLSVGATAASLASMFTLLAQGRLVSAQACQEMKALLGHRGLGRRRTFSPATRSLTKANPAAKVWSKLGLMTYMKEKLGPDGKPVLNAKGKPVKVHDRDELSDIALVEIDGKRFVIALLHAPIEEVSNPIGEAALAAIKAAP